VIIRHLLIISTSPITRTQFRIKPFGIPVVPEEYSKQIRLSSSFFCSVILSQPNLPYPPRHSLPPSTLLMLHSPFPEFITRTLLNGTPHSLAALTVTSFASSLQKMRLLLPCLTCLLNSGEVKCELAALYTPPAAMTPKSIIGRRIWPEEIQTTTSVPGPFAPIPKVCLRL